MTNAFTMKYDTIKNRLTTIATIKANNKSIQVTTLWDTGATHSCISKAVVKELSLEQVSKIAVKTPSGQATFNTYFVDILLPNNIEIKNHTVLESEIGNQNIDLLIGMDIINQGDFAVSNFNGQTVFTFRMPSECKTDYVKDIRINNLVGKPHGKGKSKSKNKKKKK